MSATLSKELREKFNVSPLIGSNAMFNLDLAHSGLGLGLKGESDADIKTQVTTGRFTLTRRDTIGPLYPHPCRR